jgi:hypothetical protein
VRSSALQRCICLILFALAPVVFAQNTGVAVVNSTGAVFLNGAQLSNSNAVTAGDVVQTKETGTATINASGTSIAVEPNSILRFQGDAVALDRGQISVATGSRLRVNARDFRITPVTKDWTQFYVTRSGGTISVIARKNDVTINCGSGSAETVKEGHQITREDADNCGLIARRGVTPTAAKGAILTSNYARWAALAAGGGLTVWSLSHGDDPVSPDTP